MAFNPSPRQRAMSDTTPHPSEQRDAYPLVEHSPDLMVAIGEDGNYLHVSAAVERILGYRPDEMIGQPYTRFVVPEDVPKLEAGMERLATGQDAIHDLESRWRTKDGRIIYLASSARIVASTGIVYATSRDVTERHLIRAELQKSKDQLTSIIDSIADAFFTVDRNFIITFINERAASFVNLTRDQLLGVNLWDVPGMRYSPIRPHYEEALRSGERHTLEFLSTITGSWLEVRMYPHEDGLSVFYHDISERRKAGEAVRRSEQRLREIIEMTPAGYVFADAAGLIRKINPAFCALAGYEAGELEGRGITELLPDFPLDDGRFADGMESAIRHKGGHLVHVLLNANSARDAEGRAQSFTAFVTDISERKQSEARLQQMATHDDLTGLPNRALVNVRLQQMLESSGGAMPIAVLFIDLDQFKAVNDSMGHVAGDVLLCGVASRLKSVMRPTDMVARLGGDEFVAAAQCSRGAPSAQRIAEKLIAALQEPFHIGNEQVFVTASIGISMFPHDAKTKEALFQNADTAMYKAKAAGRNAYRFFEAEMMVQVRARLTLEQALRHALERKEFTLHYQPRIDLKTMQLVGMEALIRWRHPELGNVPPLEFIPIAEERGLIEDIGRWVLREACVKARDVLDRYGLPVRVSVNLSARQLQCADLVEQVNDALRDARLDHGMLELEITESALIQDMDASARVLNELKAQGVTLAVDDFGTGYSGLAYLQRFPLHVLKLDRSFINARLDGTKNAQFIQAFIDFAHALGLRVVAEGIENGETLQFLAQSSCDEGQGYLLSRPLSEEQLDVYLGMRKGEV
ncbi:EAL domain-containing protein [Oxalobacteraceae bacterium OM1]|nr:EAL domain-containing protein [Oxalobacteraceae bacterium OM1]